MAQIQGSGLGNYSNTAVVTGSGELLTKGVIWDGTNGPADVINHEGINSLSVVLPGHIDENNSSIAVLGSNVTFTGSTNDITNVSAILVNTYSDQVSATDGLAIEWSSNGSNWDGDDVFTIPATKQKTFSFQPVSQFYRVKYTNGDTDQTEFRLQSILKHTNVKPSSHRIQDSIIDDDDAELTKAVITGKNPAGTFVNFQSTTAGNFKVSIEELENDVSVNSNSQLRTTVFSSGGQALSVNASGAAHMVLTDPTKAGWARLDGSTEALNCIAYEHHEIHDGSHYYIEGFTTLASGATLKVGLTTPNTSKWAHFTWHFSSNGILITRLYEDAGISGGAVVTPLNNNRNSANTSALNIMQGVSGAGGTIVSQTSVGGEGFKADFGGVSARQDELILKSGTDYRREFTSASDDNIVSFKATWYEHQSKN